jgi:hypothetical protein
MLLTVALCFFGVQAIAQNRTFVSGGGDDANPCSVVLPCRTFAGALAKTADKGEILALDTAGYGLAGQGTLNINKSVTIDGNGTRASMNVLGTDGILISDAGANQIAVTLRNFSMNGLGSGVDAIRFSSGKRLTLENMTIDAFTGKGLYQTTLGINTYLTLTNVLIQNISAAGIEVSPGGGSVVVNAKDVRVFESQTTSAMYLNATSANNIRAIIVDSQFSNCTFGSGITIGGTVTAGLDHVIATGNKWGVLNSSGNPTTRLKNSMFIGNSIFGAQSVAGVMLAYQSNVIDTWSGVTSTPSI